MKLIRMLQKQRLSVFIGRPMVLSFSPGPAPRNQKSHLQKHAARWRLSRDFWDEWQKPYKMFEFCHQWEGIRKPSTFPDSDMLPLGRLCVRSPIQESRTAGVDSPTMRRKP